MPTIEEIRRAGEPPVYIVQKMNDIGSWISLGNWSQSKAGKMKDFQELHDAGDNVRVLETHVVARIVRAVNQQGETN